MSSPVFFPPSDGTTFFLFLFLSFPPPSPDLHKPSNSFSPTRLPLRWLTALCTRALAFVCVTSFPPPAGPRPQLLMNIESICRRTERALLPSFSLSTHKLPTTDPPLARITPVPGEFARDSLAIAKVCSRRAGQWQEYEKEMGTHACLIVFSGLLSSFSSLVLGRR